jgi:hypothetical protein
MQAEKICDVALLIQTGLEPPVKQLHWIKIRLASASWQAFCRLHFFPIWFSFV